MIVKSKIKKNDQVLVIAGKDKGKKGKVLVVDKDRNRVIVEGVNIISKHVKPRGQNQHGGIEKKEGFIHSSNVMYLHKGKPTRVGYLATKKEVNGKTVTIKQRVVKSTGEVID